MSRPVRRSAPVALDTAKVVSAACTTPLTVKWPLVDLAVVVEEIHEGVAIGIVSREQ